MSVGIRRIEVDDTRVAERVLAIQVASYTVEAERIGFAAIPALHESVDDVRALKLALLGAFVDSGRLLAGVLGYVLRVEGGDTSIEIDRLVVDPSYFRRGVANALLGALHASHVDARFVVSTALANGPALALYDKHGYRQRAVDRSKGLALVTLERATGV